MAINLGGDAIVEADWLKCLYNPLLAPGREDWRRARARTYGAPMCI